MVLQVVLEFENGSREEELFVAGRPFLICSGGVLGSFLKLGYSITWISYWWCFLNLKLECNLFVLLTTPV